LLTWPQTETISAEGATTERCAKQLKFRSKPRKANPKKSHWRAHGVMAAKKTDSPKR
jgi:hypothetical protein